MGHSSLRAALICQHATRKRQRDEAIATAMGELFATARREVAQGRSGTKEGCDSLLAIRRWEATSFDLDFCGAGEGTLGGLEPQPSDP